MSLKQAQPAVTPRRALFQTVVGGLILFVPASLPVVFGSPAPWAPFPMLTVLMRLPVVCMLILPTVAFWLLGIGLFSGQARLPAFSILVASALVLGNAWWFVASWSYGLQFQGLVHVVVVAAINAAFMLGLFVLGVMARKRPSFRRNFAFHWATLLWVAWFAFPWLGELP